jgi:DUF971 family protein
MSEANPSTPHPTRLVVHKNSRVLEIEFDSGALFRLPFELLRVYSPSAEVRGHGPGQEVLQTGKREVGIDQVDPVGHYAIQPHFSDGHDTGIYTWEYLHWLGENEPRLWQEYLARLDAAGESRGAPGSPAADAAPEGAREVSRHRH